MKSVLNSVRGGCLVFLPLLTLCLTTGLAKPPAAPQNTGQPKKTVTAVRVESAITIDGELDEGDWALAQPATDFIQQNPQTGQPSTERTEVRLLYDDENLYVGVYCFDSAGPEGLVVHQVTRDFSGFEEDQFGVILDTFDDNRNGFLFNTNPQGAKSDAQSGGDGTSYNRDWDTIWHVQSKITEAGWQVEIAIPFKSLRFNQSENYSWGINFSRRIRRKNESTHWSPIPRPFGMSRISQAGRLEGMDGLRQGRNLQIKPYLSAPVTRLEGDDVDFKPEAGLDVKYGVSSQLTLDLTLNTDFAQVEADNQQINLTRFSLFFPEKREFFLENASIFQFGRQGARRRVGGRSRLDSDVIAFFSRRIGISTDGRLIPVLGGARLTGRAGPYSLGMFSMQTDELEEIPSTNFSVIRVSRDVFQRSVVGGIFVNKHEGSGQYNRTYGIDGNFSFLNHLDLTTFVLKTETPGLGNQDVAGNITVAWTDQRMELEGQYLEIGENFNPEVGFVPRVGMKKGRGRVTWTPRPGESIPWIREFRILNWVDYVTDTSGNLETRQMETRLGMDFQNGSRFSVGRDFRFERLTEPFFIRPDQAILPGDYDFAEYSALLIVDRSRMFSGEARLATGDFWDGRRDSYRSLFAFRYGYRFGLEWTWTHDDIALPSGDFSTDLATTNIQYSFNTRMFLNALIQYNSDFKEISSNIRFNWIHKPLSDLFLIYNERRSTSGEVIERALIAKLTYAFNF